MDQAMNDASLENSLENSSASSSASGPDSLLNPQATAQNSSNEQGFLTSPGSPEEYSFEFAPDTQVDTKLLGQFQQWAYENNVPLENARALAKTYEAQVIAHSQSQAQALTQQQQQFRQQLMEDAQFNKNLNHNIQAMDRGFNEFAEPGLKKLLREYGLNTHPLVAKTFLKIGKALAEPNFANGSNANREKSAAEVLYG